MDTISNMIRFHRKISGLSRNELARFAGVGKTAIYDLEHGKETVQFNTLIKVLTALNISLTFQSPLMDTYHKSLNQ